MTSFESCNCIMISFLKTYVFYLFEGQENRARERDRESTCAWESSDLVHHPLDTMVKAELKPEPGNRKTNRVFQSLSNTDASQGGHWQKAGIRGQSQESKCRMPVGDVGHLSHQATCPYFQCQHVEISTF